MKHTYDITREPEVVTAASSLRQPDGSYVNPLVEDHRRRLPNGQPRRRAPSECLRMASCPPTISHTELNPGICTVSQQVPEDRTKRVEIREPPISCDCRSAQEIQVAYSETEKRCCNNLRSRWHEWSHEKRRTCKLLVAATIFIAAVSFGFYFYAKRDKLKKLFTNSYEVCQTQDCVIAGGSILSSMDMSFSPCQDFYSFACRGWQKNHPIPSYYLKWDSFEETTNNFFNEMKMLLDEEPTKTEPEIVKAARHFYKSCMNETKLHDISLAPLFDMMDKYGPFPALDNKDMGSEWEAALAEIKRDLRINSLINIHVNEDAKDSDKMIIYLDVGYIGRSRKFISENDSVTRSQHLEDFFDVVTVLDYHQRVTVEKETRLNPSIENIIDSQSDLSDAILSLRSRRKRTISQKEVDKLGNLIEDKSDYKKDKFKNQIYADAEDVWTFMVNLAKGIDFDSEYPEDDYNRMTVEHLMNLKKDSTTPEINYLKMLQILFQEVNHPIHKDTEIVIRDVKYFRNLPAIMAETPSRVIANTLMYHSITHFGGYVKPIPYYKSRISSRYIGRTTDKIWHDCIFRASLTLDDGLVHLHLMQIPEATKKKIQDVKEMTDRIYDTLLSSFTSSSSWMDEETRVEAIEKTKRIKMVVGFPEYVLSATELNEHHRHMPSLDESEYFDNVLLLTKYDSRLNLESIQDRPDRTRWTINRMLANAFYNFEINSIQIPYGILKSPFFRTSAVPSLMYGSLGSIIGHELSHAFDTKGIHRTGEGMLETWGSKASLAKYRNKTKCFISQYEELPKEVVELDGKPIKLNGTTILTETIADNLGMEINWRAFKEHLHNHGEVRIIGLEQYSAEQLFFIAFGQNWCQNQSPESFKDSILFDSHPPNEMRIFGVLQNHPKFTEVFQCNEVPQSTYENDHKCHLLDRN